MVDGVSVLVPPQAVVPFYDMIDDLRAVDSDIQQDGQPATVAESEGLYVWNADSLAVDDGNTVIRPDDRTPLQMGRWVLANLGITGALSAQLAASSGASLIGYGDRTLESRLQDVVSFFDGLSPTLIGQIRAGTVTANLTSYMDAAFAVASTVYFPAGTYTLESVNIPEGTTVLTAGRATVFKQLSTVSSILPMLNIVGSNVTIGDCTLRGIIAMGSSEFNHGIAAVANSDTGDITNTHIGNVEAYDIRGDGVYVGADVGYTNTAVTIGDVYYDNVYRNGVALCGCDSVTVGIVSGYRSGLTAFDIEPEPANTPVTNVKIAGVRGGVFQCAPPDDSAYAANIEVGFLDLNPAFQPNSSPSYPGYNVTNAMNIRNTSGLFVGTAKIEGHTGFAVFQQYNPGELSDQSLTFGRLDASNVGSGESSENCYIAVSHMAVTIQSGNAASSADNKRLLRGSSTVADTPFSVSNMILSKLGIARYTANGSFSSIIFDGSADQPLFLDADNCTVERCTGTFGVLGANATNFIVNQTTFVKAAAGSGVFTGSATNNRIKSSTLNGVVYGDRVYGDTSAISWGEPTGTLDPSGFNTGTVTLPQLAARVASIQHHLIASGDVTTGST